MKDIIEFDYKFLGNDTFPAVASPDGQMWRTKDTSAAGAPTMVGAGGFFAMTLAADSEVENLCLYGGDILPFDIDDLLFVEWYVKVSASLASTVSAAWGLASARHDTIDSIAHHALFRCIGSNAVFCETDDAVNDVDDIATGQTLSTTVKKFCIDFGSGVHTNSPPSQSSGGKGAVQFKMDNGQGLLRRVCPNQRFNMENYTGGLQLFAQLQKTAATDVATLSIQRVRGAYRQG